MHSSTACHCVTWVQEPGLPRSTVTHRTGRRAAATEIDVRDRRPVVRDGTRDFALRHGIQ